ncbi:uncharacterized protein LOC135360772 [Latimeria chalumnae]|uniref:uncharacterized protein LOC135360772 n=1 Tax=Latimeria chalumnae TaxID=7897 RepID=UPI00313D68B0
MPQASAARFTPNVTQSVIANKSKPSSKMASGQRASSKEQQRNSTSTSSGASILSTPSTKPRPLPPGPGPLDEQGRKLETDRGRSLRRSDQIRTSTSKRGPMKADHNVGVSYSGQSHGISVGKSLTRTTPELMTTGMRTFSNLTRTKSISQNDLSQTGTKVGNISEDLSRVMLRARSPSFSRKQSTEMSNLKRSSSLRSLDRVPSIEIKGLGSTTSWQPQMFQLDIITKSRPLAPETQLTKALTPVANDFATSSSLSSHKQERNSFRKEEKLSSYDHTFVIADTLVPASLFLKIKGQRAVFADSPEELHRSLVSRRALQSGADISESMVYTTLMGLLLVADETPDLNLGTGHIGLRNLGNTRM